MGLYHSFFTLLLLELRRAHDASTAIAFTDFFHG
jgi:hypothetical protein